VPKVFDVAVVLDHAATQSEMTRLFELLELRSLHTVELDAVAPTGRRHEIRFAVYGEAGPFVASKLVNECVDDVFHTDLVAVNQRD
jgi:hypothetical protein